MESALKHIAAIWRNRTDPTCAKTAFELFWYAALIWVTLAIVGAFGLGGYLYFLNTTKTIETAAAMGTVDTLNRGLLTETIQLYDAKAKKFQDLVAAPGIFADPAVPVR